MTFGKSLIAVGAMTTLGACGGNSQGAVTLDDLISINERANGALLAEEADLPSTATMNGYIAVDPVGVVGIDATILGNMEVSADFGTSVITGTATDIGSYELNGECDGLENCSLDLVQDLPGQLDLTGTIDGVEFSGNITGELTGTIEVEQNNSGPFVADVSLEADGSFGQDSDGLLAAAILDGEAELEITIGGETTTETQLLSGEFLVAE